MLFPARLSILHDQQLIVLNNVGLIVLVLCKFLKDLKLSTVNFFKVLVQEKIRLLQVLIIIGNINQIDFVLFARIECVGHINQVYFLVQHSARVSMCPKFG